MRTLATEATQIICEALWVVPDRKVHAAVLMSKPSTCHGRARAGNTHHHAVDSALALDSYPIRSLSWKVAPAAAPGDNLCLRAYYTIWVRRGTQRFAAGC